tara:strand:- start:197873 stop:198943 length:1071 start_codon:yes stop_codon:yes gene_type:complete
MLMVIGFLQPGQAQKELREAERRAETYMMSRISDQLSTELSDLPINIRRMAIYKINYNSNRFSNESIAFIKGEIETVFKEHSPVSVISPPELDPTDKLKIVGTDSTLKLMNIKGRSLADMSPELLESVANKYLLSGLAELTLQRHFTEGLVVQIRIMSPQSREIVWTRSIVAYPVGIQEKDNTGKNVVIRFGTTVMSNEFYTNPIASNIENSVETSSLNYNFNFGYRQSFNEENSGYLGFYTGFNIIRSNASEEFEADFWELGISFDQAISMKNEQINDYRVMLGVDSSVWLAMGDNKGNLITFNPSLILNMTKNIGFELYGQYFLGDRAFTSDDVSSNTYTYGQFGYGVKAYVQF